jgi:phosphopantetheinyl transferase (holo-ACP synthase)
MTLPELYEQQRKEWEHYQEQQLKAWQTLQKQHEAIAAAFGGKEHLSPSWQKQIDSQIANYHAEWANDSGQRHQEIVLKHEQQRVGLSGNPIPPVKQQAAIVSPQANDNLSDRQEQLQKIIAQQQAIRKRQQEKKRGR